MASTPIRCDLTREWIACHFRGRPPKGEVPRPFTLSDATVILARVFLPLVIAVTGEVGVGMGGRGGVGNEGDPVALFPESRHVPPIGSVPTSSARSRAGGCLVPPGGRRGVPERCNCTWIVLVLICVFAVAIPTPQCNEANGAGCLSWAPQGTCRRHSRHRTTW